MDCEEVIKENVYKYPYVSNEGILKKKRFNVSGNLYILWILYGTIILGLFEKLTWISIFE